MIDDEKIIEMFFGRSEQGIRELDTKYGKDCHNLSYHIVGSRQDAEECVNDAYLGAWNAIPPARPNPLLSYIMKIVRNISLKIYWRKEAAKRSSHYTIALEEIEACIADQKTVEDEIEARELARIIEDFLDTLTVENRVIFMRRYPNISRILTKINAIPCSCLFIQSHSFVKFKFVDFILLQNYEQFNHRKRGINHVLHPRADRPRQPSRPCFFPAITGRAAYPRRTGIPLEAARQPDRPGKQMVSPQPEQGRLSH